MFFNPKPRNFLIIYNRPNNIFFTYTNLEGKTQFIISAKAAHFRSKQVHRAIVIDTLWTKVIQKLKMYKPTNLGIKIKGLFFKKRNLLTDLKNAGIKLSVLAIESPNQHNGSKKKHFRRV